MGPFADVSWMLSLANPQLYDSAVGVGFFCPAHADNTLLLLWFSFADLSPANLYLAVRVGCVKL